MGIFDFLKGSGKKDVKRGNEADDIKRTINAALGDQLDNLDVAFRDGTAKLSGTARSAATKEKVVLLAGNLKGVEKVDDGGLRVRERAAKTEQPNFYTIEKGRLALEDRRAGVRRRAAVAGALRGEQGGHRGPRPHLPRPAHPHPRRPEGVASSPTWLSPFSRGGATKGCIGAS